MVSALKNAGANVNYLGGNNYSAAHSCVNYINVDGFKALVSAGANLKTKSFHHETVIEYAARK